MNIALLNPAAMWMLTALAIPLIIHFLHRGQRERVLVGSIRFLKGRETQTLSRLKLTEKRLLLLRMLLLTLLALLLARPHWRSEDKSAAPPGWLLMDARLAGRDLPAKQAQLLERAEAEAWRISWLTSGFPDATESFSAKPVIEPGNLWSLVAEAAMDFPDDHPMTVITLDRRRDFEGAKPRVRQAKLDWYLVADENDGPVLEYGYMMAPDRLLLVIGQRLDGEWIRSRHQLPWSGQARTHELKGLAQAAESGTQVVSLQPDSGNVLAMMKQGGQTPLAINATVSNPRVLLVSPNPDAQDVGYLRLGLKTVADHYNWPLDVQVASPDALPGEAPALAFWLGNENPEPPGEWYAAGTWNFRDAGKARFETGGKRIDWQGRLPGSPAKLSRRIPPKLEGEAVWVDAWGTPVLEMLSVENGRDYFFSSRFLPDWSDLVFHEAFPVILAEFLETHWLSGQPVPAKPTSSPAISPDQVAPILVDGGPVEKEVAMTSLAGPVWLLMMLVFLAERWWRSRRQAQ